jgi:uncharacterized membrane protein YraQ (UPF0718 family)
MNPIFEILAASWHLYHEAAVYMLFGFFIAAFLYAGIKSEKVACYLGTGKYRPVFLAALIGIPIPLCSCGVIPAAAGLKKQGASKGATLSFLISTPESGVDSIAVTYALLDPIMTVARPLAAFITAVFAGVLESLFGKNSGELTSQPQSCACSSIGCSSGNQSGLQNTSSENSFLSRLGAGIKFSFGELLGDIGKWFIIGILLAGVITFLVPDTLMISLSENPIIAMILVAIAAVPMYVCATASTPIAAALIMKGLNPGAALVFLLLGPATNMATISMVSGLLGKRSLLIYLGSILLCSFAMGFLLDAVYMNFGIAAQAVIGQAAEIVPSTVESLAAFILAVLLLYAMISPHFKRKKEACAQGAP